jgi:hypothetical protein
MNGFAIVPGSPWPRGQFPVLAADPVVAHAVTTRDGPDFGRVGTSTQTAHASADLAAALGLAGAAWAHQVHGGAVLSVRTPGRAGEADGLVTATPGLALVGRSADCPLVLVAGRADAGRPAVGMAHASWRSTVAGITARVIARLRDEFAVAPTSLRAAIAPSAGPCCYEVGEEVRDGARSALGPGADAFFRRDAGRLLFDLWAANTAQLTASGVPREQIEVSGVCTICQGARFWSWRMQGEQAGRFAGAIGILAD